jgi:hypothetical protein
VTAEDKAWGGSHLLAKLKANPPDVAGAAEEAFKLLTDASFLTVFAEAAIIAGQKYGVPVLTQLTPAILGKVLLAANLVVLIGTLLSWDVQYFLAAYGEVKVTWLVPPAAPTGTGVAYAGVVCPDGQTSCDSFVLTWREATGSVTGFRIYTSYSWGECLVPGCGPEPYPPCDLTSRRLVATVGPAVRRYATVIPMSVPYNCWFISAVNQAGASRIIYMGG